MTIFRCEPPHALIEAFLDARHNWYADEIQTLTGYDESEFQNLLVRPQTDWSAEDLMMFRSAAATLLALPTTSVAACEERMGENWVANCRTFLDQTNESAN